MEIVLAIQNKLQDEYITHHESFLITEILFHDMQNDR